MGVFKRILILLLCLTGLAILAASYLGLASCEFLGERLEKAQHNAQVPNKDNTPQAEPTQHSPELFEAPVVSRIAVQLQKNLNIPKPIHPSHIARIDLSNGTQQVVFFETGRFAKLIFADTEGNIVDTKNVEKFSLSRPDWWKGRLLIHDLNGDGKQDIILYGEQNNYSLHRPLSASHSTLVWVYFQTDTGFDTVYAVNDALTHPDNSNKYPFDPAGVPGEQFYEALALQLKPKAGTTRHFCKNIRIFFDIPDEIKNSITITEEGKVVWLTHNNRGLTAQPVLFFGVERASPEQAEKHDGAPRQGPFLGESYQRYALGTLGPSILMLRESFTTYSPQWKEDASGNKHQVNPFIAGSEKEQKELSNEYWLLTKDEAIRKTLMLY